MLMKYVSSFDYFLLFRLFCRVLKPPGGGSSDLFGGSVPTTPRSTRNNMASNIFAAPNDVKNGNGELYSFILSVPMCIVLAFLFARQRGRVCPHVKLFCFFVLFFYHSIIN